MNWTHVILKQLAVAAVVAIVAALLGGKHAGMSSVMAGMSCVIPNTVMLSGLHLNDRILRLSGATALFIVESVKISLTLLMIAAVFWQYKDVNFIAFLVSFIISLKSYVYILLRTKN